MRIKTLILALILTLLAASALAECPEAREPGADYVWQIRREEPVAESWFADAWLMGDSITESLANVDAIPELNIEIKIGQSPQGAVHNRDYVVDGQYYSMAEYVISRQPAKLLVMLGSNGLDHSPRLQVQESYHELLDMLLAALPDTELYLVSVTPITPQATQRYPKLTMPAIKYFNQEMAWLAEEHGVHYVDVYTPLLNESKTQIDERYCTGDGIHLTRAGAMKVAEAIRLQVGEE